MSNSGRPAEITTTSVHIPYNLPMRPYHKLIARLVSQYAPRDGRILDVGCGVGNMLELVRRYSEAFQLVGADIDQHCLDLATARVRIDRTILIDDVLDLGNPALDAGKFDVIVLSHVLEHVFRPYDTVRTLMTLLKPGGHLIMAVPNPVRLDVMAYNLIRRFDKVNKGHVQTWDRAHWRNFLENILELNVIAYPTDFIRIPVVDNLQFLHPILHAGAVLFPGFARSCMAVVKNS
jgi:2-polyprenyl-3-methyl-5-hydroxy-6-metoxy-1,4-benzoquinol methylase